MGKSWKWQNKKISKKTVPPFVLSFSETDEGLVRSQVRSSKSFQGKNTKNELLFHLQRLLIWTQFGQAPKKNPTYDAGCKLLSLQVLMENGGYWLRGVGGENCTQWCFFWFAAAAAHPLALLHILLLQQVQFAAAGHGREENQRIEQTTKTL